jgi:hypothetical protein
MTPDDVRSAFPEGVFGPACSDADLARAESQLRMTIPAPIRALYASFNGFMGPTASRFLWPLSDPDPNASALVEMNRFFRAGWEFPQRLMERCFWYGENGIGQQWGLKDDLPGKVILWDAAWGDEFEIVGDDPLKAWLEEKQFFEEASRSRTS